MQLRPILMHKHDGGPMSKGPLLLINLSVCGLQACYPCAQPLCAWVYTETFRLCFHCWRSDSTVFCNGVRFRLHFSLLYLMGIDGILWESMFFTAMLSYAVRCVSTAFTVFHVRLPF